MQRRSAEEVSSRRRRAWLCNGLLPVALAAASPAGAANGRLPANAGPVGDQLAQSQEATVMRMTVGARRFSVALENTPTVQAVLQMLPATWDMTELNGNEKYARLGRSLPTAAVRPDTIRAGDVLLYGSDTLVVFYDTFQSSYSYTRIGRIDDPIGLAQALGPGSVRVTFSLR